MPVAYKLVGCSGRVVRQRGTPAGNAAAHRNRPTDGVPELALPTIYKAICRDNDLISLALDARCIVNRTPVQKLRSDVE